MDLGFLEAFSRDIPQGILNVLKNSKEDGFYFTNSRFNVDGSYLALGCSDGGVIIWDTVVNKAVKKWHAHYSECDILSLSWSASGRFLLSLSTDWTCCIYDLKSGSVAATLVIDSVPSYGVMHPNCEDTFIIATSHGAPRLCSFSAEYGTTRQTFLQLGEEQSTVKSLSFDPSGLYVLLGTLRGVLLVYSLVSRRIVHRIKLSSGASIKQICMSSLGQYLLINGSDRTMRVYGWTHSAAIATALQKYDTQSKAQLLHGELDDATWLDLETEWFFNPSSPPLTLWHLLQDLVNRCSFSTCTFSPDDDYVVGGCNGNSADCVYIWQVLDGRLVKVLQGVHESIDDLTWHPIRRGQLVTVTEMGQVLFWGIASKENWSNFAPDFVELYKNIEYEERENEFDVLLLEKVQQKTGQAPDSALWIDVESVETHDTDLQQLNPNVLNRARPGGPRMSVRLPLQLDYPKF